MKQLKRLPDSELEVMLAVWQGEPPVHTGEILRRMGGGRKLQSVQIFLGRLVEKGFLHCDKVGRLNHYTPLVGEAEYRSMETNSFLDKLYGSSPLRLMAALVRENKLSSEDLDEIRRMLEGGEE